MRVLIVEDESLVAMLAGDVVESCGYSDAMTFAAQHEPDVAILDRQG